MDLWRVAMGLYEMLQQKANEANKFVEDKKKEVKKAYNKVADTAIKAGRKARNYVDNNAEAARTLISDYLPKNKLSTNIVKGAFERGNAIPQAVVHPIETAKAVAQAPKIMMDTARYYKANPEKIPSDIKNAIKEDPLILTDVAGLVVGGAGAIKGAGNLLKGGITKTAVSSLKEVNIPTIKNTGASAKIKTINKPPYDEMSVNDFLKATETPETISLKDYFLKHNPEALYDGKKHLGLGPYLASKVGDLDQTVLRNIGANTINRNSWLPYLEKNTSYGTFDPRTKRIDVLPNEQIPNGALSTTEHELTHQALKYLDDVVDRNPNNFPEYLKLKSQLDNILFPEKFSQSEVIPRIVQSLQNPNAKIDVADFVYGPNPEATFNQARDVFKPYYDEFLWNRALRRTR